MSRSAYITSPTTSANSVDAIATTAGIKHGKGVILFTALEYSAYVKPEELTDLSDVQRKAFSELPKFMFASADDYSKTSAEACDLMIVAGGRNVAITDFINAIESGKSIVILDNQSLPAADDWEKNGDGSPKRPNNASSFLVEKISGFLEGRASSVDALKDMGFRITPETTGSGRFLESIPADKVPMYLVIDAKDGRLQEQIQAALDDFGKVDTVIDVDTGGDCLYRTGVTDATKATPDQDLESLRAVSGLKVKTLLSCVIAKGVDSPDYADEVLTQAKAQKITFSDEQKVHIFALYKEFELDGSNPNRYGKTPFAWQAALRGETGRVRIPLPDKVVNDAKNPWNPYVNITPEMAGGYVMKVSDHLRAIILQNKGAEIKSNKTPKA
ncbi:MAG: hypothetical protein HY052_09380 [Proteobacteria bacterium]|nr:hypothetical protein [Pseudomonadota bacterium]